MSIIPRSPGPSSAGQGTQANQPTTEEKRFTKDKALEAIENLNSCNDTTGLSIKKSCLSEVIKHLNHTSALCFSKKDFDKASWKQAITACFDAVLRGDNWAIPHFQTDVIVELTMQQSTIVAIAESNLSNTDRASATHTIVRAHKDRFVALIETLVKKLRIGSEKPNESISNLNIALVSLNDFSCTLPTISHSMAPQFRHVRPGATQPTPLVDRLSMDTIPGILKILNDFSQRLDPIDSIAYSREANTHKVKGLINDWVISLNHLTNDVNELPQNDPNKLDLQTFVANRKADCVVAIEQRFHDLGPLVFSDDQNTRTNVLTELNYLRSTYLSLYR